MASAHWMSHPSFCQPGVSLHAHQRSPMVIATPCPPLASEYASKSISGEGVGIGREMGVFASVWYHHAMSLSVLRGGECLT